MHVRLIWIRSHHHRRWYGLWKCPSWQLGRSPKRLTGCALPDRANSVACHQPWGYDICKAGGRNITMHHLRRLRSRRRDLWSRRRDLHGLLRERHWCRSTCWCRLYCGGRAVDDNHWSSFRCTRIERKCWLSWLHLGSFQSDFLLLQKLKKREELVTQLESMGYAGS